MAQQTEFFVILGYFLLFHPHDNSENQKFGKLKTLSRDIVVLHMCTINDNHMMYGSWDMKCNRQKFLLFWTIFCPFTPMTSWKINILKNWKKCLDISSFYTSVPKAMIIWYIVPLIRHETCNFLFWAIFCPFKKKLWPIFMDGVQLPQC